MRHTLFLPLLLLTALLPACRRPEPVPASASASGAAAVPVTVRKIETRPFSATVAVTGSLVSRTRVDIKAETIGHVVRFPKEEGQQVEAGEPVVWLDDENYRLAVAQAEAFGRVAEAALERARVVEKHAQSELQRARNLLQSGGITDKDLKAAELADRDARAQVSLAEAQLEQARAALEVAHKRLRDTVIHAPVRGEIEKKFVNPGAYVEAPTPLFTLVDNRRLELESPVPAAELAAVRAGQPVTFSVNSYPDTRFHGRVMEINPAVDPDTRSARVRIQADNHSGQLKAGMFAVGEIRSGVERQAVVIPASAVYREDGASQKSFVFVVENHQAVRRLVRIGRERNGNLEILEGLEPGALLIAEQSVELADGVPVEPKP